MKRTFHKLLCLLLALTMVVGLLPAGMFAGAATDAVVLNTTTQMLVDDDFADFANKEIVTAEVGGVTYQATMGTNAFTTLPDAVNKAGKNGEVYVAAGRYTGNVTVTGNISLYGNGMDINPNNDDWSLFYKRADESKETVLEDCVIAVTGKALTKFVVNGFSFVGKAGVSEATSGSSFKGIDIRNNYFHDNVNCNDAGTQGVLYFTGNTTRNGGFYYNRIENSCSAKPLTFRNGDNFIIQGNYSVNTTAGSGFWISAEMKNGDTTPGFMKMQILDNYFVSGSSGNPLPIYLSYAETVDLVIRNNYLKGKNGIWANGTAASTADKKIVIENNTLDGSNAAVSFESVATYKPSYMTIRNNNFVNGKFNNAWESVGGPLDLAYNYFGGKTATAGFSPSPILYPQYTDAAMTKLVGDIQLEAVGLTGVKANGDMESIVGTVVDNDAQTATLREQVDSVYQTIKVDATPKANSDGSVVKVEYYADMACTQELTDGNVVDYLKKGNNLVYIKLITSKDNYSYRIFTLTIPRSAAHDAEITGIKNYEGSISGKEISITVPAADINPNIQFTTSAGATYALYSDADLTKPLGGTVISNLAAGTFTYYVKVTAEDGETNKVYTLKLTRPPYAATDIIKFNSPDLIVYDDFEPAYVGVYSSDVETVDVDIEVSDRASWALYKDAACQQPATATGIALETGDNIYFIKVTSEGGAATKTYKLILTRETADASKQIYSVKSEALASSVEGTVVTIKIATSVKEYLPAFEYAGKNWKLYASYENGVLSDNIPNNKLTNIPGGKHTYYIEVIAKDNSTKVYTLCLERDPSKESKLTAIGGATEWYVDRFDFVATTVVQNDGNFTPTFTVSDGATVQVMKEGSAVELPLALRPGISEYVIVVTAEDGVTTTEYGWSITCVGDGVELLSEGVVYDDSWSGYEEGTAVYATVNGIAYKAYIGENAYADLEKACKVAVSGDKIVYVMPGVTISEDITLGDIKLYGANFKVDANNGSRFIESVLTGSVTLNGVAAVNGFTLTETASIINDAYASAEIVNNIFYDNGDRATHAIVMEYEDGYESVSVENNRFEMNSAVAAVSIAKINGTMKVVGNEFANAGTGSMLTVKEMSAGSTVEFDSNVVDTADGVALWLGDDVARMGYLYVHDNTFTGVRAITLNAAKADSAFSFNFNNNKVDTTKLAVNVYSAPADFANNFVGNQNSFASIDYSFMVEYATGVTPSGVLDITENYYGVATPGNEMFDTTYNYKPYYVDAAKTQRSNAINAVDVTVNYTPVIDNNKVLYAVVGDDTAYVEAKFAENELIPAGAYGTVYVSDVAGVLAFDNDTVTMDGAVVMYVTVVSLDQTVVETQEVYLYAQSANPVYDVYDVINSRIDGMKVSVVVDHDATTWTPSLLVINDLPISFYADAACKEALNGAIALTADSNVIYGKAEGYETVEFTVYKKLSYEKAILSLKDAYTFEYTAADAAKVTVDDRLTAADLSAVVSEGAIYSVYTDVNCLNAADETQVTGDTTLYYYVLAADGTYKIFEITVDFVTVVDPTLVSVENATTTSFEGNQLVATVASYEDGAGFITKLNTAAGCTYKLYADAEHTVLVKNNTTFFASNYVYVYAVVTSPDGVVSADYTIKLEKETQPVKFVDKVPNWAKKAVEFTKDLGIVNGVKDKDGLHLNPQGTTTREMMACFIVRMLGVDISQYSYVNLGNEFADADQISKWALGSMKAAVELGLFEGTAKDGAMYLDPKSNITREQFATVFVRAIDAEDEDVKTYNLSYGDATKIGKWARTSVKIVTKLGIMKGSSGNFSPKADITRAEIIQTIYNYMK